MPSRFAETPKERGGLNAHGRKARYHRPDRKYVHDEDHPLPGVTRCPKCGRLVVTGDPFKVHYRFCRGAQP
jgi:hypothetical protein